MNSWMVKLDKEEDGLQEASYEPEVHLGRREEEEKTGTGQGKKGEWSGVERQVWGLKQKIFIQITQLENTARELPAEMCQRLDKFPYIRTDVFQSSTYSQTQHDIYF